ncbi:unnamed protein product, partial [Ectocarpus sp. 8 AP-2014]
GLGYASPYRGAYPHNERRESHLPFPTTSPTLSALSRNLSPPNAGIAFTTVYLWPILAVRDKSYHANANPIQPCAMVVQAQSQNNTYMIHSKFREHHLGHGHARSWQPAS